MKEKKNIQKKTKQKKLPVTIITGYLGSGKTTLVNHILTNNKKKKIAVIVNEFGEIGIDNELIVKTKEDIIELSNGCICCQVRGDIINMILKIIKTHKNMDALMIETSGLANPTPVAQTFFLKELQELTELDAIISLVDADHFEQNFKRSNGEDQIKAADIILLNKKDTVSEKKREHIRKEIKALAPHARIYETQQSKIPLQLILNIGQFDIKRFLDRKGNWKEEDHEHDEFGNHIDKDGIISCMFKTQKPMDITKFQRFAQQLPENIFRSKGIIWFKGLENKAVYQQVGRRIDVKTAEKWNSEKKKTMLVFIGQQFDWQKIEQELKACLA